MRNLYESTKIYSGGEPELIEGDVFKTTIPLELPRGIKENTLKDTSKNNITSVVEISTDVSTDVGTDVKLTPEKLNALLEFCNIARSRREMQDFCGIKTDEYFRKNIITPMLALELINMTFPDKPKSRNQKYVRV